MTTRGGWSGRCLSAGLVLPLALLTQACVSISPWRDCPAPCKGVERASRAEICMTDGVPVILSRIRTGEDERGTYIAGRGETRLGQDLGDVKVYADEVNVIRTSRVEAGRVGANLALLPLAALLEAHGWDVRDDDEDSPPECPAPERPAPPPSQPGADP